MDLIVGLGNPGSEYRNTRHNAGFMVVDEIGRQTGIKVWGFQYKGRTGKGRYRGDALTLLKPRTYMNLSGHSVRSCLAGLKLKADRLIVVHDDMDLPLGRIRVRGQGGDGGHKGIRSIIDSLGTNAFARVRIGIGRPSSESEVVDYVLTPFSMEEKEIFEESVRNGAAAALAVVSGGLDAAMNKFNSK